MKGKSACNTHTSARTHKAADAALPAAHVRRGAAWRCKSPTNEEAAAAAIWQQLLVALAGVDHAFQLQC
jgi:hypothetical protein